MVFFSEGLKLLNRYWLACSAALFMAVILLSLWPLPALPVIPGTDKTHHFIAYTMVMIPVAVRKPACWLLAGLFFILGSGLIELIQPYVNRYAEWLDFAANSAGIACGALIGLLLRRYLPHQAEE